MQDKESGRLMLLSECFFSKAMDNLVREHSIICFLNEKDALSENLIWAIIWSFYLLMVQNMQQNLQRNVSQF